MLFKNIVNVYFYMEIFFYKVNVTLLQMYHYFMKKIINPFMFFFLSLHEHVYTLLQIMFKNHLTLDSCWLGICISKATFKF